MYRRHIIVEPYDEAWQQDFINISSEIRKIFFMMSLFPEG